MMIILVSQKLLRKLTRARNTWPNHEWKKLLIWRMETTNYRTVQVPTGNEVHEFVQNYFGKFYVDVYRKNRTVTGRNNVFVEYAWNISGNVTQFCDPCNGPPPMLQDLMTVGVDWVQ